MRYTWYEVPRTIYGVHALLCFVAAFYYVQRLDIAHPMFWTDGSGSGSHPAPFTLITSEDIQQETWVPVQGEHKVTADRF